MMYDTLIKPSKGDTGLKFYFCYDSFFCKSSHNFSSSNRSRLITYPYYFIGCIRTETFIIRSWFTEKL